MKTVTFPIDRVNRLREAAVRARDFRSADGEFASGWIRSRFDATKLVHVFEALSIKAGYMLKAYEYVEESNGNGIIWAVPAMDQEAVLDDFSELTESLFEAPRPAQAVPLMQAIEGDGSPWSYLSASILGREAAEFGAIWHGCWWSDQTILSKPPRQASDEDLIDDHELTGDAPLGDWTWHRAEPRVWEPAFHDKGAVKEVVLHIFDPMGQETVYRTTDTYEAGSFEARTETIDLCTGDGFRVY